MACLTSRDKIFVAGHKGLVGSAILRNLQAKGYKNIVVRTRKELELLDQEAVTNFYREERPTVVFIAAAKVGGIYANNNYRADFIYENLQVQNNLIWGAHKSNVHRLIFLGSSCIYPKEAPQPMDEDCLLTSPLEFTNRPYAIAKIAGIELVGSLRTQYRKDFFAAMPTNLYGPFDNFHPQNSHVLPALIRRFIEATERGDKVIKIWGTGRPKREFLHADDCADALVYLAEKVSQEQFDNILDVYPYWCHVNIGGGDEVSIKELAELVKRTVGFTGDLEFDTTQPDGTLRKLLNVERLHGFGWTRKIGLEEGLAHTVAWYKENRSIYADRNNLR